MSEISALYFKNAICFYSQTPKEQSLINLRHKQLKLSA